MFEYHFHGLDDGDGEFVFTGTTHDFLQVVSDIAKYFDETVSGQFVKSLMQDKKNELDFIRVVDWKFEYTVDVNDDARTERSIVLSYRI